MPKLFFPEGVGGVHKTCGNSVGVGGLLLCSKNGNSGEERGDLREIPSVVGVWIFSGTTHSKSDYCSYSASIEIWPLPRVSAGIRF